MIPQKLTLHNFMSYKNPDSLDFSSFNLACLAGDNGVGKSSLLEAVSWVLWGKTRAISDDDLINQEADEMWVEFIFQIEKNIYKVIRKRSLKKKGYSELYLFSFSSKSDGFHSLSEDTIAATQEKIEKLLKIPYKIFINSAYLRQGKADEFATKTAAERKQILSEILDLESYEELSKIARERARSIKSEIEFLENQIEEIKNDVSKESEVQKNLIQSEKEIRVLTNNIQQEKIILQKLQQKISEKDKLDIKIQNLEESRERIIHEGKTLKFEIEENKNQIEEINKELSQEKQIQQNLEKLKKLEMKEKKLREAQLKILDFKRIRAGFESDQRKIETQIEKISHISTCPTCLRKLPKKDAQKIISNLKQELKKDVLAKIENINLQIKALNYSTEFHQKINSIIDNLKINEEKAADLKKAQAVIYEKNNQNSKIIKEIKAKKQEYLKTNMLFTEMKEKLKIYLPYAEKYDQQSRALERAQDEFYQAKERSGILKQEVNQINQAKKELELKEKKLKENLREGEIFIELGELLSKKGVQARILETAIPEIEREANVILGKLSNGNFQIRLITQKEKKTKTAEGDNLIETLDIQIKDSLGVRKYEMFSGGEAFRINFALRIAISKFLSKKSGAKLQFLAIDEGFGTQDDRGRQALVEAINSISKEFEKIIVITHIQELKDSFETRIDVTKDDDGSHIKMIY